MCKYLFFYIFVLKGVDNKVVKDLRSKTTTLLQSLKLSKGLHHVIRPITKTRARIISVYILVTEGTQSRLLVAKHLIARDLGGKQTVISQVLIMHDLVSVSVLPGYQQCSSRAASVINRNTEWRVHQNNFKALI